jgi:hypothetical protein
LNHRTDNITIRDCIVHDYRNGMSSTERMSRCRGVPS